MNYELEYERLLTRINELDNEVIELKKQNSNLTQELLWTNQELRQLKFDFNLPTD